jgi:hypothetical protein
LPLTRRLRRLTELPAGLDRQPPIGLHYAGEAGDKLGFGDLDDLEEQLAIGATGFSVRGLVIVLQIRSSGIPRAFISLTWLRRSRVGSNFSRPHGFAGPIEKAHLPTRRCGAQPARGADGENIGLPAGKLQKDCHLAADVRSCHATVIAACHNAGYPMSSARRRGGRPVVNPLSIGVAIASAIALVAGITKGGVDVLGVAADPTLLSVGAVGLMLALTTFRSPLISPFLRVFSTIFAVEYVVTGLAYVAVRAGWWLPSFSELAPPASLPTTLAIFGLLIH